MKTDLFLAIHIISGLAIMGCNHDKDITPDVIIPKLKTEAYYYGIDTTPLFTVTYEYNEASQLVLVKFLNNSYSVLEYDADKVTIKSYDSKGIQSNSELILNGKGLLQSGTWLQFGLNGTGYKYNADNYLIEKHYTSAYETDIYAGVISYTITSGNTTSSADRNDKYGILGTDINKYQFILDKINTIGNENRGLAFLGKSDKNLLEKWTTHRGANVYFEYEFDSKGRVTKPIELNTARIMGSSTYTYMD